jgi:hypothetical protein
MAAIFSPDPTRVGMAIDVLTGWLCEERALISLAVSYLKIDYPLA